MLEQYYKNQVHSRAMEVMDGLHVTEEDVLHTVQHLGCHRADHCSDVVLQEVNTTIDYSAVH